MILAKVLIVCFCILEWILLYFFDVFDLLLLKNYFSAHIKVASKNEVDSVGFFTFFEYCLSLDKLPGVKLICKPD